MFKKFMIVFFLCIGLISCSSSKKQKDFNSQALIDLDDVDSTPLVPQDDIEISQLDNGIEQSKSEELVISESEIAPDSIYDSEEKYEVARVEVAEIVKTTNQDIEEVAAVSYENDGEIGEYTVQPGDTLIIISYKLFGHVKNWRSIASENDISSSLIIGQKLSYSLSGEKFDFPEGESYLILDGDTLGKISTNIYQTNRLWRHLWKHNEPLIYDPDMIFAGLTVYYLEAGEMMSRYGRRPVASVKEE